METNTKRLVTIYTEANPNPNSMKFALNFMLVPDGTDLDYPTKESTTNSPLAAALFDFEGVERVFFMSNFLTITKSTSADWYELGPQLKSFIKSYLEDGNIVFSENPEENSEEVFDVADKETVGKIKNLLEEYVRPAVESDGGAINFHKFEEGVVTVKLRGSCSGCPSSTLTLKAGIENLLKRMLPEVKEVVAMGV